MYDINLCKGCRTPSYLEEHNLKNECCFRRHRVIEQCPCLNCLIKVTCIHGCYEFESKGSQLDEEPRWKFKLGLGAEGNCNCFKKKFCTIQKMNQEGECPCNECLVKAVCKSFCAQYAFWAIKNLNFKIDYELARKVLEKNIE
jgi:hypothetical protein